MLTIDKNLSISTRDTDGPRFDFPLNEQTAQDMRIIQRNVIYAIGVPTAIANETILSTQPYFGQYGQILKIIVKRDGFTTGEDPEEYSSAYITYSTHFAACLAILSIQSKRIEKFKNIQASYATTKYCKYYVQRKHCKIKAFSLMTDLFCWWGWIRNNCELKHKLFNEGFTLQQNYFGK